MFCLTCLSPDLLNWFSTSRGMMRYLHRFRKVLLFYFCWFFYPTFSTLQVTADGFHLWVRSPSKFILVKEVFVCQCSQLLCSNLVFVFRYIIRFGIYLFLWKHSHWSYSEGDFHSQQPSCCSNRTERWMNQPLFGVHVAYTSRDRVTRDRPSPHPHQRAEPQKL